MTVPWKISLLSYPSLKELDFLQFKLISQIQHRGRCTVAIVANRPVGIPWKFRNCFHLRYLKSFAILDEIWILYIHMFLLGQTESKTYPTEYKTLEAYWDLFESNTNFPSKHFTIHSSIFRHINFWKVKLVMYIFQRNEGNLCNKYRIFGRHRSE